MGIQSTGNNYDMNLLYYLLGMDKKENKTESLPMPDFSGINYYTKTASAMSEEKYNEAIEEQARKDAANGNFQKGSGFQALKKSYVSVGSPDRKGIIASAKRALKSNSNATSGRIYDKSGNIVGMYDKTSGWRMVMTPQEAARTDSFHSIYNAAYNAALEAIKSGNGLNVSV